MQITILRKNKDKSFEKAFFNDSAQKKLKDDDEKIGESLYIVSEVLSGQRL